MTEEQIVRETLLKAISDKAAGFFVIHADGTVSFNIERLDIDTVATLIVNALNKA